MKKNTAPKTGLARLMEIAATKKALIICAGVLSALAALASFIPYLAIYFIVSEILASLPGTAPLNNALIIKYGWVAFAGAVGNILLYFVALVCSHLAAFGTLYELKINFAAHLAKLPLGFHIMIGSGKLRKITDENIEKIEGFIAHQLPDLVAAFVAPVAMIIILLAVEWRLGLAAMAGVIIAFSAQISMYGNKKSKIMMQRYQSALEDMNNASVEYVRGISVVKAFRQTVFSFRRMHEAIKAYTDMVIPYTLSWENSFSAFAALVNNLYLFVVPAGIIIGMHTGDYQAFLGKFIFYLIFVQSAAAILMKVMYVNGNAMRILGGVESMDAVLAEPEIEEPQEPQRISSYDVNFTDVFFSYDKKTEALAGVTFTAPQGRITAIVGPSGGGKSTIAHLVPRFFDVDAGSISIGGVDVRRMSANYLMAQVSFVFQDVFLFRQSVLENIRLGRPEATEDEVVAAAQAARCHDFAMALPHGYRTVIGAEGVHLSGGERQRIAIARAIVKDSPVVVLDEATAFADPENEHLIQKAFETLMKNKTVIMIAHRLSTVRGADKILVVDHGRVLQSGTHEELLRLGGQYGEMWKSYTESTSWTMNREEGAAHV